MGNDDIEDILDRFDFEQVKKAMDALEWKYWDSEDKTVTIYELRKKARYLLNSVDAQKPSEYEFVSSGGFEVERRIYPGDSKKYFYLKFVVTEWNNED